MARAFRAYPTLCELEADVVHQAPESLYYRNRARMVCTDAAAPSDKLGFYQAGSREVLPIERCVVHHPAVENALDVVRSELIELRALDAFTRFVDVRATAGFGADSEATIVTCAGSKQGAALDEVAAEAAELADRLTQAHLGTTHVHLNVADSTADAILSGRQVVVRGRDTLSVRLDHAVIEIPPDAFFQLNPAQLSAAHARMRVLAGGDRRVVLDLYCGVGVHGIALAARGGRVIGFDASEDAVAAARLNAARAHLHHDYLAARDEAAVGWLSARVADTAPIAVANPARAGLAPSLLYALPRLHVAQLLYLSCEPQTLARDADRLAAVGYHCTHLELFDFLPRTEQVEALARFEPSERQTRNGHERAHHPADGRRFSTGVSGPRFAGSPGGVQRATWIALVRGRVPGHGFLPQSSGEHQARVQVDKLRNVGPNSAVRLQGPVLDDRSIRERLRAWGHPVIGDPEFGNRRANHLARRDEYLDRIALHCVKIRGGDGSSSAPVPGSFCGLMRLPRGVLERVD